MVYQSTVAGGFNVYVRPFPNATGGMWPVSGAEGGQNPEWRDDGQEIFYRAATTSGRVVVMAVSVKIGKDGPELGSPRVVWQRPGSSNPGAIAITKDGQRALVAYPVQATDTETPLTVIVNWTRLLAEK